jgi:N-methylhydantoinase A
MQSSGGLIGASAARVKPVQMIESGPAAGIIAVRDLARRTDRPNVVSFDMGGTTAKASLIENGEWFDAPEYEVGGGMNAGHGLAGGGGYVIRVPSIDISEVGAGGGSICWVDDGGSARVGPRSAGASPGPACYGRGGDLPTLTDANVVLGYLSTTALAGGSLKIDAERARNALRSHFADPLGLDLHEAAYGAFRIAVSAMSKAVKAVTSQRGRDPRDFALVAFGGAGPMYAAAMADEFQMNTVLIPPNPGLFSAIGLLVAEIQQHAVASIGNRADLAATDLATHFANLESELVRLFADSGYPASSVLLDRYADMRYRGQSSELRVAVHAGPIGPQTLTLLADHFADEHERSYGHRGNGQKLEILNLRVKAHVPQAGADRNGLTRFAGSANRAQTSREAYFGRDIGFLATRVIDRSSLADGALAGPAIVEEMDATTLIPPGWLAALDAGGAIVLERST